MDLFRLLLVLLHVALALTEPSGPPPVYTTKPFAIRMVGTTNKSIDGTIGFLIPHNNSTLLLTADRICLIKP